MIGPEDIQQTQKTNYTPIIVLGVAAALLIIVGFISYSDYVNAKADKKLATAEDRMKKLEEQMAKMGNTTAPTSPSSIPSAPVAAEPRVVVPEKDPEIEALRRQLAEMKRLQEENTMKMDRVLDQGPQNTVTTPAIAPIPNTGSYTPPPLGVGETAASRKAELDALAGNTIIDEVEIPAYLKNAVNNPPGGQQMTPQQRAQVEALSKQILNSPSIGKILSYDTEWGFVTINAGTSNGIRPSDRFSIRRGSEILGEIVIQNAEANQAMALFNRGRKVKDEFQPRQGDDIIASRAF